jgi:hypothetical protein
VYPFTPKEKVGAITLINGPWQPRQNRSVPQHAARHIACRAVAPVSHESRPLIRQHRNPSRRPCRRTTLSATSDGQLGSTMRRKRRNARLPSRRNLDRRDSPAQRHCREHILLLVARGADPELVAGLREQDGKLIGHVWVLVDDVSTFEPKSDPLLWCPDGTSFTSAGTPRAEEPCRASLGHGPDTIRWDNSFCPPH